MGLLDVPERPEKRCGPLSNVNVWAFVERVKECAAPPGRVCASRVTVFRVCVERRADVQRPPRPEPIVIMSYVLCGVWAGRVAGVDVRFVEHVHLDGALESWGGGEGWRGRRRMGEKASIGRWGWGGRGVEVGDGDGGALTGCKGVVGEAGRRHGGGLFAICHWWRRAVANGGAGCDSMRLP